MNLTIETILQHRSIRKFTEQPIAEDQLSMILDCAIAASSSSFIQCVSIVRITDTDKRVRLAEYAGGQTYVASAAEFLVFFVRIFNDINRFTLKLNWVSLSRH